MFKCIHIKDFDSNIFNHVEDSHIELYRKNKSNSILINLQDYLLNENTVFDVDTICQKLFSDIKPDIFLSHAHADEEKIISLAAKIEFYTGLKVFVDSCVWGNAYELLNKIDNEYCYSEENGTYEYQKRNHTTSNVFMILNAALHRVINSSEVLLFLGTDNSISIQDLFTDKKYISSPWIFSELQFANLVKRDKPLRYSKTVTEAFDSATIQDREVKKSQAQFAYSTPDSDFDLNNLDFQKWIDKQIVIHTDEHPLDQLYAYEKLKK